MWRSDFFLDYSVLIFNSSTLKLNFGYILDKESEGNFSKFGFDLLQFFYFGTSGFRQSFKKSSNSQKSRSLQRKEKSNKINPLTKVLSNLKKVGDIFAKERG